VAQYGYGGGVDEIDENRCRMYETKDTETANCMSRENGEANE
jgi:hypothetical protein